MTKRPEKIKKFVQEYMTKDFYIEGEDKDYYFGTCPLNDNLTIFYNELGEEDKTVRLIETVYEAIQYAAAKMAGKEYETCYCPYIANLYDSSLRIPVYVIRMKAYWHTKVCHPNTNIPIFSDYNFVDEVNYMQSGVLEKAIKEQPERWEMFKKEYDKKYGKKKKKKKNNNTQVLLQRNKTIYKNLSTDLLNAKIGLFLCILCFILGFFCFFDGFTRNVDDRETLFKISLSLILVSGLCICGLNKAIKNLEKKKKAFEQKCKNNNADK